MTSFLLNDNVVRTDKPPGLSLLDFIRNTAGLSGTKTGCREGDCGACTVLKGEIRRGKMHYYPVVSCLTPLGSVNRTHIVTIEGLNNHSLSPVQEAIINHSGTQCGFCTPGFVLSLTGFIISGDFTKKDNIIASVDGNICRCTGYKSLERAALAIYDLIPADKRNNFYWLASNNYIPSYFLEIQEKLSKMVAEEVPEGNDIIIGGGTDLMVQKADEILDKKINFVKKSGDNDFIIEENGYCRLGGAVTVRQMLESEILLKSFPQLRNYFSLISSTPIRNMATLAGNIVNASPIADLVVFLLALDTWLILESKDGLKKELPLKDFYTGYKKLNKKENEYIIEVKFVLPHEKDKFNFEKVSKRRHLDIASVNSAICIREDHGIIGMIDISAGGVAPIPLYLTETSRYLTGKQVSAETILSAISILMSEIKPISDIRGSAGYKRLLLRQLFLAHFNELYPGLITPAFVKEICNSYEKQ